MGVATTPLPLLALLLPFLLLLLSPVPVLSQQQYGGPGKATEPLHDVLMLVFDKDKNGKVTESEMTSTMGSLEMLLQEGGDESGENPYLAMLKGAQAAAPDLFALLDADYSKGLTKDELKWTTKFQKALKNGDARVLVRECFKMLDVEPEDEKISAEELRLAFAEEQQQESRVRTCVQPAKTAGGKGCAVRLRCFLDSAMDAHHLFVSGEPAWHSG